MDRRGSLTSFEMLEADWADLRRAFEALIVDRHRGLPVDETGYLRRRRAFGAALATVDERSLPDVERAGIACMRGALPSLDEYEPLDEDGPDDLEPLDIATLRRATYEAYGEAASAIRVGAETIDRLTAFARLATEPDASTRRSIFEAMDPVWRSVDGDGGGHSPYRRLVAASAERWAREGSPIEANAAMLGIDPGAFEPMLRDILAAGRRALGTVSPSGTSRIEPWDVRYIVGEAERRLGGSVPRDRLRSINDEHLRSLGADPDALRISYDIFPRPDRPAIPVAFAIGGEPGPWVFATYEEGGLGNLAELLHESGHAIHEAAIRTRSAFAYPPADHTAFIEAIAELTGWDIGEPGFQARHLGIAVEPAIAALDRYGPILLDVCWALFEIEIHRSPVRRPNDLWSTIVADGLGLEPHPEWSWWAVRGQLIDSPGYLANYPLGAIAAAAMRARIRDVRGDWSAGDPGWYAFVSQHLLRFGGERSPAAVLEGLLGGPLTAQPLLDDLARAG